MRHSDKVRGYALVFVLGLVALVSATIVAFLLSATTEKSASAGFAAATDARQLADTAVSLVQGQINHATTRGPNVAWVSQPGMVRTFNQQGELVKAYKLYSAPDMVTENEDLTPDLPKPDWADHPATWVDLNAPVTANNRVNFPILDPKVLEDIVLENNGNPRTIKGLGPTKNKGMEINAAPGATGYSPAPMPVRWLYVLKDGQVVVPDTNSIQKEALLTATADTPGATKENPIVGRIAFWTDDESAKININTASEGTFWDVPRGYTETETMELALKQPAKGEFQRYPGHPAMVCLSSILPGLDLDQYLGMTPRYRFGGSEGGTLMVDPEGTTPANAKVKPIIPKPDRFYTTIDELAFSPDRTDGILDREVIESRDFLLTANSRAPETNLFNLPRIASWPIYRLNSNNEPLSDRTSPYDRLIAFASSVGAPGSPRMPYFFQRELSDDPANDLLNIGRNMELYSYLQVLTSRVVPGFGGSDFNTKYGADRDQILTQIFDYIRSTNLYDDLLANGKQFTKRILTNTTGDPGHGFVAPIYGPGGTMGQGRFHTLRQMNIAFIANAASDNAESNVAANRLLNEPFPVGPAVLLAPGQTRVQAMVYPELFSTMVGWRGMRSDMTIKIEGLDQFRLNGKDLQFPKSASIDVNVDPVNVSGARAYGANMYYNYIFVARNFTNFPATMPLQTGERVYPFVSSPVTVPTAGPMVFEGGEIIVTISYGKDVVHDVQTFKMEFPDSDDFPVPTLNKTPGTAAKPKKYQEEWTFFSDGNGIAGQGRLISVTGNKPPVIEEDKNNGRDVIRALLPTHGDFRLIATTKDVAKDSAGNWIFKKHPWYDDTSKPVAALFEVPGAEGDHGGKLVAGAGLDNRNIPSDLPPPATVTGDFDMGPGNLFMGAAVNKPDEGDIRRVATTDSDVLKVEGCSIPYFGQNNLRSTSTGATFFSPNRIIPSPVMFGSLPTGVRAGRPWQTVLFRPDPSHPGSNAPPDHLLLDLFWMPVVEPYAISDRFSTAGKVNMNYQIVPFTYIERSAPMRAVLAPEKITRIPTGDDSVYPSKPGATPKAEEYRTPIDVDETLRQFEDRFTDAQKHHVFISASEICNLHLVPQGETVGSMSASWDNYRQTADNVRERNYATIYPKLTTKSNTFTVHFRVQALKKVKTTPEDTWIEGRDVVLGEYRGSTTIERFINPAAELPDYAKEAASLDSLQALDDFYRWRVVRNRQFAP